MGIRGSDDKKMPARGFPSVKTQGICNVRREVNERALVRQDRGQTNTDEPLKRGRVVELRGWFLGWTLRRDANGVPVERAYPLVSNLESFER